VLFVHLLLSATLTGVSMLALLWKGLNPDEGSRVRLLDAWSENCSS